MNPTSVPNKITTTTPNFFIILFYFQRNQHLYFLLEWIYLWKSRSLLFELRGTDPFWLQLWTDGLHASAFHTRTLCPFAAVAMHCCCCRRSRWDNERFFSVRQMRHIRHKCASARVYEWLQCMSLCSFVCVCTIRRLECVPVARFGFLCGFDADPANLCNRSRFNLVLSYLILTTGCVCVPTCLWTLFHVQNDIKSCRKIGWIAQIFFFKWHENRWMIWVLYGYGFCRLSSIWRHEYWTDALDVCANDEGNNETQYNIIFRN